MLARFASFARDASGAVAPLFAVSLIGLAGVGALAWDVSRGYALKAELEAAVDAAALAGATQLDGESDAITRANSAALGALVQNSSRLADAYAANTVGGGDTIQYLVDLTTRTVTTDPAQANFIEITLAPRPMGLMLGALVGASGFNARAHAVAGYGSALCKVPPMMICNPDESVTFDPSAWTGKALVLTPAPNSPSTAMHAGLFGFLTISGGANAIKDALARSPPLTECYGETVTARGGNIASADDYINTRFDIYVSGGPSGLTSNSSYTPAMNTMIGRKTDPGSSACNPTVLAPTNTCAPDVAIDANGMGLPIDCGQSLTTVMGSGEWNVEKYFANNHSGITNPVTYVPQNKDGTSVGWDYYGPSPSTTGVTRPTRYQVYNWEVAMLAGVAGGGIAPAGGTFSSGQTDTSGSKDYAKPQCHTNPVQTAPDRRTISAVVLNCAADTVHPNEEVTVRGYLDLFLIGPVPKSPQAGAQTLFAEVVEATTDTSAVGQETRFYSVRLYE